MHADEVDIDAGLVQQLVASQLPEWASLRVEAVFPLGTDNAGRDVVARLVYGTRISLTIGLFAVSLYVTFGTILGALAGYYGGAVDLVILRAIEVMISIPSIFRILALAAFIENRSIFHIMLIIAGLTLVRFYMVLTRIPAAEPSLTAR